MKFHPLGPHGRIGFAVAAMLIAIGGTGMPCPAHAQSHQPMHVVVVAVDGAQTSSLEMGLWGGIVGDEVAVSGTSLPRSRVRFVCPERCPDNLPSQPAEQDTVVWKDGTRTGGRVEVRCENNSNSQCYVSQDGKPSKPKFAKQAGPGSWNDVNYVYLKN